MIRNVALPSAIAACIVSIPAPTAFAADIKGALDQAVRWLAENQNPDGGYGPYGESARIENASDVGITGLVLTALARHPRDYQAVDGPFVSRAVDLLLGKQQENGGIWDPRDPSLQNYRTSVAIMALCELDRELYAEPVRKAREFVEALQFDESMGYERAEHLSYGGIGYGSGYRADISNSGIAASALRAAGTSASSPTWRRLAAFVSRAQNAAEVDPLVARAGIGTTGDGGFRYAPNDTRGPVESVDGKRVFRSYGSMTYQGLKTLLYAGVDRDDPRVVAAFDWISKNFDVRENPGMASKSNPKAGQQGLYYYYHTMAKALAAYGEPVIVDAEGVKHDWARELSEHLVALQKPEGYWVNETGRWWEDIPELDTALAMIALSICLEELDEPRP